MNDNRTTERVRKLLDERGIEYSESQDRFRTRFRFNYCEECGDYLNEIEIMGECITALKSYLTPEQAIAVTLGSETPKQDVDSAYSKRIGPRVRKENSPTAAIREWSVFAHSVMELTGPAPFGEDGNVCLWLHENSLTRLLDMCDAIDDKFATLGRGICHWEYQQDENGFTGIVKCSNCGHQFSARAAIMDEWKCCPVCKAVVGDD